MNNDLSVEVMVEAVFFDIDGTLISNETHEAVESTIKALNLLRKKGIKLFISTGRAKAMLNDVIDFEFDGYITLNGQYCYDRSGKVIYEGTIEKEDLVPMLEYINKENIACYFVEDNEVYCNFRNEDMINLENAIKVFKLPAKDIIIDSNTKIYQISPCVTEEQEKALVDMMPHTKSTRWHSRCIDLFPIGGTKLNGIQKMCEYYGFDIANTMAFGDSDNDVEMLSGVGLSVAMGDGKDCAKEAADYITDDVAKDGIYKALKHFELI